MSSTTTVASQCHIMMMSHSKYYEFPKPWVRHVKWRQNHRVNIDHVLYFRHHRINIELFCYVIRSTSESPRGSAAGGWHVVSPAAAESPRDIWWTLSRNNTVLLFHEHTKPDTYITSGQTWTSSTGSPRGCQGHIFPSHATCNCKDNFTER